MWRKIKYPSLRKILIGLLAISSTVIIITLLLSGSRVHKYQRRDIGETKTSFLEVLRLHWLQMEVVMKSHWQNLHEYTESDKAALRTKYKNLLESHSFKVYTHMITLSKIVIIIEESVGGHSGAGGSTFDVKSESIAVDICPYDDHFNGTYIVACPITGSCTDIMINLTYIDFLAFRDENRYLRHIFPLQLNIWKHRFCHSYLLGNVSQYSNTWYSLPHCTTSMSNVYKKPSYGQMVPKEYNFSVDLKWL